MDTRAHFVAVFVPLVLAAVPQSAPAQRSDSVQGLIEGRIHAGGVPLAGAIVTACAEGHEMEFLGVCTDPIEGRANSFGDFSFRQTTGRAWPSASDVKKSPILALATPWYAYGFRVDYEGKSAIFVASGAGYGRTHARMNCDFQIYLNDRLKKGARPIADSAKPEHAQLHCKIDETISERRE